MTFFFFLTGITSVGTSGMNIHFQNHLPTCQRMDTHMLDKDMKKARLGGCVQTTQDEMTQTKHYKPSEPPQKRSSFPGLLVFFGHGTNIPTCNPCLQSGKQLCRFILRGHDTHFTTGRTSGCCRQASEVTSKEGAAALEPAVRERLITIHISHESS